MREMKSFEENYTSNTAGGTERDVFAAGPTEDRVI